MRYQSGTNYAVWDGKDDSGNTVSSGTNYQIKLIYHNVQYVWQGMVGNTSKAQSGPNVYHSYNRIHDLAIGGNIAYYAVGYNEGEDLFHQFTVGAPQVPSQVPFDYDASDVNSVHVLRDERRRALLLGQGLRRHERLRHLRHRDQQ